MMCSRERWASMIHSQVFEGVNLGAGLRAVSFGEEYVVILPRVEGRVEVDEVDGLVFDVALEDFVVVAVVELVFGGHGLKISGRRERLVVTQCGFVDRLGSVRGVSLYG